jgi:hypothetical protein
MNLQQHRCENLKCHKVIVSGDGSDYLQKFQLSKLQVTAGSRQFHCPNSCHARGDAGAAICRTGAMNFTRHDCDKYVYSLLTIYCTSFSYSSQKQLETAILSRLRKEEQRLVS